MLVLPLIVVVVLFTLWMGFRSWAGTDPRRWVPDAVSAITALFSLGWLGTAARLWSSVDSVAAGQQTMNEVVGLSMTPLRWAMMSILGLSLVLGALAWRGPPEDFRRPRGWIPSMAAASVLLLLSFFMLIGMYNFFGLYGIAGSHSGELGAWVLTYVRGPSILAGLVLLGSVLLPVSRMAWRRRDHLRAEVEELQELVARLPATPELANLGRAVEDLRASLASGGSSARALVVAARKLAPVNVREDAPVDEVLSEVSRLVRERAAEEEETQRPAPPRVKT